jgi:poly-gamma-glutamate capsule biosynthesis protein CapA/YwtB (metallophosphatase superfamily)
MKKNYMQISNTPNDQKDSETRVYVPMHRVHHYFLLVAGGILLVAGIFGTVMVNIGYTEDITRETQEITSGVIADTQAHYEKKKLWQRNAEPAHPGVIIAVGDIMLDRGVRGRIMNASKGKGDWAFPFMHMEEILRDADLSFANMESVISERGTDSGKKFSFRVPPDVAPVLADVGFDVLSIANNHTYDWGAEAQCDTATILFESNIAAIGAGCNRTQAEQEFTTEIANTRVGFLAYTEFYTSATATENRPGFAQFQLQHMIDRTEELRNEGVEVVMVSLHWGIEYRNRSSTAQQELAHALIEGGVDVVIGHHPHVDQEIERYGDGWIIYSLGNFVFDQSWSEETMEGMLAKILVADGSVIDIEPHLFTLNRDFQPQIPETLRVSAMEE